MVARSAKGENRNGNGDRDANGRWRKGCKGGPGNPLGPQVARLRAALVHAVTEADIRAIAQRLVKDAKAGNRYAARLLFAYVLGRPQEADLSERLEALEAEMMGDAGK